MPQPILADWFYEFILRSSRYYHLDGDVTKAVKATLTGAHRYVFPKRTTQMAEEAVKAPRELAQYLTLPSQWVWLEFVDPDEGILINAAEDLRRATTIYVIKNRMLGGRLPSVIEDDPGASKGFVTTVSCALDLGLGGLLLESEPNAIPERFQKRLMGAITLLGAPDLLDRKTVEHSRKWNEARAAKGKVQHLDHEIIELHLTRYEKTQEAAWRARQTELGEGHSGRHVRLHFVRSHIRITNRGKVTKVKPHYRGDPNIGITPHTYIVRP